MNKDIAHINDVAPRRFRMLLTEFLGQHIGSLTNNHDVVNHCMKTHNIAFHFLKGFPFKEIHHMDYACFNVIQALNIPNSFSHRPASYLDWRIQRRKGATFLPLRGQPPGPSALAILSTS